MKTLTDLCTNPRYQSNATGSLLPDDFGTSNVVSCDRPRFVLDREMTYSGPPPKPKPNAWCVFCGAHFTAIPERPNHCSAICGVRDYCAKHPITKKRRTI